uniref:Genome polyprotein n=1 Tax=Wilkes virus TaxID=2707282 RepID=A0A6H0DID6_9VIRU|nr:MAG: polyprotein [Wilkes virus]
MSLKRPATSDASTTSGKTRKICNDPQPLAFMRALNTFNCVDCAYIYAKHYQRCYQHREHFTPYTYAARLAARDHEQATHTLPDGDPLEFIENADFWNSVRAITENTTKCFVCAASYCSAYYRRGTTFEEWKRYIPNVYKLRKHAETCTVVPQFEFQGAGHSTSRTVPRTRAGGYARCASVLAGPNQAADNDLTAKITAILADDTASTTQILDEIRSSIASGSSTPPRATLAQVWRNLNYDNAPDRAAALLTAVTLWLADADALDSAELKALRPVHNPVKRNWVETLKAAVSRLEQWFVSQRLGTHMRSILEVLANLLDAFASGAQSIDSLLSVVKPIPVMAMLTTFDGTPLGLATLIFGLLQLYNLLDSDLISGMAGSVVEALSTFSEKVFAALSPFGVHIEPQSTVSVGVAVAAMVVVWTIGHLPQAIGVELRRAATTATSLLAIFKLVKLAFDLARRHVTSQHVNSLTDRVLDVSIDIVKPANASAAPNRRTMLRTLHALQDEITSHMIKVDYAPHQTTLKALNATVTSLIVRLNQIEGQGTMRTPPVGIVFCGPPGIGKTTLATWVLDQISPDTVHSNFTMQVDHADSYTGENTCLWDEFDTDANGAFVEGVIGIFNKTAYPLNCDLAENKGRTWSSKVVAMTTNTPTPVAPDSPRAHAFYRRLIFYDVASPSIQRFMQENPGVDPPSSLFKDDFSHLRITRRPYLAYTPMGDTLEGVRARPISCTPKAIIKEIMARVDPSDFEAQAGPPQTIGVIVPPDLAADVRCQLLHAFSTNNSFVKLVEAREALTQRDLHNPRGGHIIVTATSEDPAVKDWYVATNVNQAAHDLNTMLGLCPRLPHSVNKDFRTRLFRTIIHAGALPPSGLPPSRTFECKRLGDFLKVLATVYGPSMLPIIARIATRIEVKSWTSFFGTLSEMTWGHSPHSYCIRTDTGVFSIYTQDYMAVFSTTEGQFIPDPNAEPPASSLSVWELFKRICRSVCAILAANLNTAASATAMVYYARLNQATPQSATRGLVRNYQAGVALSDDEYNSWREYNTRVDRSATVNDFIRAREMLQGIQATSTERVAALARWLRARDENVLEPQSGNYGDYTARFLRADGTHIGWAVHIGNGRWAVNTHSLEEGKTIDGHEYTIIKASADDVTIVKAHEIRHCAQLGSGPPVRSWDSRPVHNVYEHTVTQGYINAKGWLGHLNGGTYKGDCGLPYFNSIGQVCGMHTGFFRGTRQVVVSKFDVAAPTPSTWRGIPVTNSGVMLGPLRKGTAYSRSVAHPETYRWECFEPAPYGGGDPRNCMTQERILAKQLEPYIVAPPPLNPVVDEAAKYVKRHIATLLSFAPVPTLEPFCLALKRLDLSTSCGPFVPGIKRDYFSLTPDGPVLISGTEMTRHLDSALAVAASGRPIPNAYQLALKDELLPAHKVAESRKRLLWGTDVALTTLACMVWGRLLDAMKSIVVASPISVGCQMDSTFVATMVSQIQNKHTLCLDFKKWDSTMHPGVIHHAVDVMCDLVPESPYCDSLRATLHQNPEGYFMDKKVVALRGLPSGTPATSVVNSICHCIYFVSGVWESQDRLGIARTRDPLSECRIWTYGDDCVYGLSPRIAANMDALVEAYRSLGLNPTAADKTLNFRIDAPISFLKRDIVPLDDLVVGRLDLNSILRQAVWVRGSNNMDHTKPNMPRDTAARTVQMQEALLALALHGKETYEKWVGLFRQTITAEGLCCEIDDWDTQMMLYRSRYMTADPYSNAMLQEGDITTEVPENEFEFQNGDKQQQQTQQSDVGNAQSADAAGLTTSYTPSQTVAGTAGGPIGESLALQTLGAGLPNTLPSGVEGLFVASARFSWHTTMPPRTTIGTVPLNPFSNPFLKLLSQMYAGWSGGLLTRIQISGSGMYGGRLIACITPPGVMPNTVTNPTAYPYVIVDARVSEPVELMLPDIRQEAYHTVGSDVPTSSLLVTVSSPLINPFQSATNQTSSVEVTVYTCPSPDFTFCLMKEPTSQESLLINALGENSKNWTCNRTGAPITVLQTAASAQFSWNHYRPNGTTPGWGTCLVNEPFEISFTGGTEVISAGCQMPKRDNNEYWPLVNVNPRMPDTISTAGVATGTNMDYWKALQGPVFVGSTMDNNATTSFKGFSYKMIWGTLGSGTPYASVTGSTSTAQGRINFFGCYDEKGNMVSGTNGLLGRVSYYMRNDGGGHRQGQILQTPGSIVQYAYPGAVPLVFTGNIENRQTSGAFQSRSAYTCGQPLETSKFFMNQVINVAEDTMLIYRLTGSNFSFEIGVNSEGYCVTGGTNQNAMIPNEGFEITFSGFGNNQTRLVGPVVSRMNGL